MRVLFIVLFLAGCGSGDEGNNNHGYGFQYDVQGAAGMKLRGGPDAGFLENLYAETEACTGLSAPDPFVIVVTPGSLDAPEAPNTVGIYWNDPPLVLLDISQSNPAKHEFIHYLMDVVQHVQDPNHTGPLWKCQ